MSAQRKTATIHGIDPYAPDGIEQLLEFHRNLWGYATMEADEDQNDDDADADSQDDDAGDSTDQDSDDDSDDDTDIEGADALGDRGKKALDAMKQKWRNERKSAREIRREFEEFKRKQESAGKPDDEQAIESARAEARAEATSAANRRIVRSEAKAAAAGKLADPGLISKLADLDDIEVDDDGNVDQDALNDAIEQVLESYPSLAAQRSTGKFDSARGKKRPGKKYTPDDLKSMTSAQVAKAYDDGLIQL